VQICIYGAGAGVVPFATRLAACGVNVSVIARGPHLAAIQNNGLTLCSGNDTLTARVKASDDPKTLGRQDVVIVAVKATALQSVADGIAPLQPANH
jgi:2-dehydropantoate 2-reductase